MICVSCGFRHDGDEHPGMFANPDAPSVTTAGFGFDLRTVAPRLSADEWLALLTSTDPAPNEEAA